MSRRTIKSSRFIANKLIKHHYLETVGRLVHIKTENTSLANIYLNSRGGTKIKQLLKAKFFRSS